jgi:hypothetical protein
MASAILSGASTSANSPSIIAEGAQLGECGLLVKGGAVSAPFANLNGLQIKGVPGGATSATLYLENSPLTPLLPQRVDFVNASSTAGGEIEGQLQVFTYNNGAFVNKLVDSQVPPRGSGAGPTAILGTQAIWGMTSAAQGGVATIPLLATTIAVANTAITAQSVVLCSGVGALNATATLFTVVLNPGVGFNITTDAAPTVAAKSIAYFVVRY